MYQRDVIKSESVEFPVEILSTCELSFIPTTMWGGDIIGVRLCSAIPSIFANSFFSFSFDVFVCVCVSFYLFLMLFSVRQMRLINNTMSNALGAQRNATVQIALDPEQKTTKTKMCKKPSIETWGKTHRDNSIRKTAYTKW